MRRLLTEAKSLEKLLNAFQKRNPNIDTEGLKTLLLSDPTIVSNDRGVFIGKYATWIGNLFAKGLIKPGDSWELKKALSIYSQNKENLLPIEKYTSLDALLNDTMKFAQVAKKEAPAHKEALEKVYEDDEWAVYIPHTYRASRQIGQGTHWCTASSNPNYYESYTQYGDLYVNIRKSDDAKFQIHFESKQAMDANDRPVALGEIGISEGLKKFYLQRVPILSFLKIYYKECDDFSEGLARVQLNRKWGYIDTTDREVIPLKYDWIGKFSEGLAVVKLNEKYGCIDKIGREVIPFKYDYIMDLKDGLIAVQLNGKWDYINKRGNWYGEKPSVLPESITKITISDIRYMVNECINRLI